MRNFLCIVFLLCVSFGFVAGQKMTMRVDLYLAGVMDSCEVKVDDVCYFDGWSGPISYEEDEMVKGNMVYSLYDASSGELVYRDGFSSLYCEWATMEYKDKDLKQEFEHVLLMPYWGSGVRLVIECRRQGILEVVFDEVIDESKVKKISALKGVLVEHLQMSNSSRSLDVAILAEGYTEAEKVKFRSESHELYMALMKEPSFNKYSDKINVSTYYKSSQMSGPSDLLTGYESRTVLGSAFGIFGSDRYLETFNTFAVYDYVGVNPCDIIIVLVNSSRYGGGGVYNCFAIGSVHGEDWIEVLLHELGHSFAGLADEYYYEDEESPDLYPLNVEPWEPNVTTKVDFGSKWKDMYERGMVDLVEGAAYNAKGLYRSEYKCKMRILHEPFCKVCQRAIERQMERYVE